MATRGKTTFQKRQKEMARKQKQENKAQRREQRKMGMLNEDRTPPEDSALPAGPESEGVDVEGTEQPAQNLRPTSGGQHNA
jgi:hypothetical protein